MRPSVRSDLVTLGDHTFNNGRVWLGLINWSLVQVVAGHEESSFESV